MYWDGSALAETSIQGDVWGLCCGMFALVGSHVAADIVLIRVLRGLVLVVTQQPSRVEVGHLFIASGSMLIAQM